MSEQRARWGDKGATIVEFAFVGPVLFALLFIFMDFSLVIAGNSAGSNAARDGVRIGSIRYIGADDPTTVNGQAVRNAVLGRLENLVQGTPTITVSCIKADSGNTIPCQRAVGASAGVEENRDLIQVKLDWTHLSITPFLDSDHTETVRATITGAQDLSQGAAPLAVFFDDPDSDGSAADVNVNEPNGPVNLIIHRSGDSAPELTITLGPGLGTTAQGADYVIPSPVTMPAGVDDLTVPITIVNDIEVEADEVLVVEITGLTTSNGADSIVGLPQSVRIIIDSEDVDSTPPVVTTRRFIESTGSVDGRVDLLQIVFDSDLGAVGSWNLVAAPAGVTLSGSPQLGGDSRTVNLTVAGGSANTGGVFQVSGTGIQDTAGNSMNTGTLTLADQASPVLLTVTSTQPGGGTAGRADNGDIVTFRFSEPITPGALSTLAITSSNATGGNDHLSIPGLVAAGSPMGGDYLAGNGNKTATFPLTVLAGGADEVRVQLGACSSSGNVCTNDLGTVTGSPILGFTLSGTVGTADARAAVMPTSQISQILF